MIENVYPKNWQETRGVFSPAKKIDMGNYFLIYVSGIQADKNEHNEVATNDISKQTENIFHTINEILLSAGASMENVVKAQIFLTDIHDFSKVSPIRDSWFSQCKPVSTLVEVSGMTRKGAKIEIEVTAIVKK